MSAIIIKFPQTPAGRELVRGLMDDCRAGFASVSDFDGADFDDLAKFADETIKAFWKEAAK